MKSPNQTTPANMAMLFGVLGRIVRDKAKLEARRVEILAERNKQDLEFALRMESFLLEESNCYSHVSVLVSSSRSVTVASPKTPGIAEYIRTVLTEEGKPLAVKDIVTKLLARFPQRFSASHRDASHKNANVALNRYARSSFVRLGRGVYSLRPSNGNE